ncbi:AAA family ATPase [Luteipulveratus flavus]|uniref:AAA family ATPase n=1 Tax=Luteipulveratus flavus TaxID=3031728 RepID=A0ABT6CA65_9MICO|nr:AAA family ATPase [Luteipulveratus sp. YIM 133296]MDF8265212.1 AAA family ATPase [Luteipulveratus sp. YIM 133296]
MRITRVETSNVGGLADCAIDLPKSPVAALAGGNGTGKSKLMACILSPWSGVIPVARPGSIAEVNVHLQLTSDERGSLNAFSELVGWGQADIPEKVTITTRHNEAAGYPRSSEPNFTVLTNGLQHEQFARSNSSLNVIYLPAERRLVPPTIQGIDLNQLSELIAWQKTAEPRAAVQNYGRLDDAEFESFAKALCVAASLPNEEGAGSGEAETAQIRWEEFRETVDALIAPKALQHLTRQHPEQLRIRTGDGDEHAVEELSSGERQALIIISRVMRAGSGHTLVLIDEPDAYLHPHLSQRLIDALSQAVGQNGQLIAATHSPSILDRLPASNILRLAHGIPPRLVADEDERLELYRVAGFRASALTQSDLLMIVEGELDYPLLNLLMPELARASIRWAGGRAQVMSEVANLAPHDIPVWGVVDRDVLADEPAPEISESVVVWPTADLEGAFLSDPGALQVMQDRGLISGDYSEADLREILDGLLAELEDNVVAELAQRSLRTSLPWRWPSPKGPEAQQRLREAVAEFASISSADVEAALSKAKEIWDAHPGEQRWHLVRGKYLLNAFAQRATHMNSGRALLEAVARDRPNLAALDELRRRVDRLMAGSSR